MWIARWDHVASLTGWAGIPDSRWANHQRAKQYWADTTETYGGVTMTVDSNRWDAPVATVAYTYTADRPLNARSGPGTSYPVVDHLRDGHDGQGRLPDPGLDRRHAPRCGTS